LTAIKRVQRSEEVRRQLDAAIRRGDYAPGDRLPSERELVETFGVSRVSVREGIRLLEALGRVTVRHGSGVYVTDRRSGVGEPMARWVDVHRDEVVELVIVRASLDALAAEEAAAGADDETIEGIRRVHEAFVAAVEGNAPIEDVVGCDTDFHLAIAEASGNRLLYDLLSDLHHYLAESRYLAFAPKGRPERSAAEHTQIVEALLAKDVTAARAATARHIASVRDVVSKSLAGKNRRAATGGGS
jgi:DNA-binding FadR family transcriptional regulator